MILLIIKLDCILVLNHFDRQLKTAQPNWLTKYNQK